MKIAQVTDIHIPSDVRLVDGVDVRESLLWALEEIRRTGCELLVVSGDLVAHEDFGAYRWIAEQLAELPIPVLVMSGNHDDTPMVVKHFGLAAEYHRKSLHGMRALNGVTVYGLDTSSGVLPKHQLGWLREQLDKQQGVPLLFMHHPPIECGCLFMDSHSPLKQREDTWQGIVELGDITHVFCGHYHTYKKIQRDGIEVVICPSTELQIDQGTPDFKIEHRRPGYLEITVEGTQVSSSAIYREE